MFANQRRVGVMWGLGGSPIVPRSVAEEAAPPRRTAGSTRQDGMPRQMSVRGQNESESTLGAAMATVTESTSKAYRTVASGTSKAYNTVVSGTSRAFRSTKDTLLPWTASDAQAAKKNPYRRELPPEKGEVIVKHWYEFWKADPEEPPKPKTVQDFLSQPRLE
jgi:hypothetical protein